ncbi:MAG: adenylate/guanylate cyclase domain-containing protein [Candidatus Competibacteraceae bacterium]|nr:adenylate/guanylate cyclase domain-containing protein [Candidatus Competibacteraceae bacterium]
MAFILGKLRLGVIGEADRIQGGVIGDAVNLASRLQDMTKRFEVTLLISEDIFRRLQKPERYTMRAIGKIKVKGRKQSVGIFEVLDGEDPVLRNAKQSTESLFQAGIDLYIQGNVQQAKQRFEACHTTCPQDGAAKIYLNSCNHYLKDHIDPLTWEGIPYLGTVGE